MAPTTSTFTVNEAIVTSTMLNMSGIDTPILGINNSIPGLNRSIHSIDMNIHGMNVNIPGLNNDFLLPLRDLCYFIEFKTKPDPILKILLCFVAFGADEDKAFHLSLAVDHRLGAVSLDGLVKFLRSNAAHQPVVP